MVENHANIVIRLAICRTPFECFGGFDPNDGGDDGAKYGFCSSFMTFHCNIRGAKVSAGACKLTTSTQRLDGWE